MACEVFPCLHLQPGRGAGVIEGEDTRVESCAPAEVRQRRMEVPPVDPSAVLFSESCSVLARTGWQDGVGMIWEGRVLLCRLDECRLDECRSERERCVSMRGGGACAGAWRRPVLTLHKLGLAFKELDWWSVTYVSRGVGVARGQVAHVTVRLWVPCSADRS